MLPSHWTKNDLIINGASLHYIRTGDGQEPPLVLAHGFSDDSSCWLQTAGDLETSYDIIMPGAWVHAYLHRVEGDEFYADYWYRKVGRPHSRATLAEERDEIVAELCQ